MFGIRLSLLPLSARVFCTLYLAGIGCGAVAALVLAATAVGLSPKDVKASLGPEMPMKSMGHDQHAGHAGMPMPGAEKEIDITEISAAAKVWIRTPLLIQTSHTHLFGQTLIAGLLGLIFLFSSVGERLKTVLVALPFVATLVDIGGMWLTRFVSAEFAVLVTAGGSLFGLGYLVITTISFYELWLRKERLA